MARFTKDNAATMGSKGGNTTVARHGSAHMSKIGARGFWVTVTRHWNGDAAAYVTFLILMGRAATDPMPENGYTTHGRKRCEARARSGYRATRRHWRPRSKPDDDLSPF